MDKKSIQLGMNYSTASHQLRKSIMFSLVQKLNLDVCFQCGKKINSLEEFSIEHKVPWLEDDIRLFWDLDNIAFSHFKCNCSASRVPNNITEIMNKIRPTKRVNCPEGTSWCYVCKQYLDKSSFTKSKSTVNGLESDCRNCRKLRRSKKKQSVI